MTSPEVRESQDGVIKHIHIEYDEKYLQSVLDEFNAEQKKPITLAEAKKDLTDMIMDEAYYSFQNYLEDKGSE